MSKPLSESPPAVIFTTCAEFYNYVVLLFTRSAPKESIFQGTFHSDVKVTMTATRGLVLACFLIYNCDIYIMVCIDKYHYDLHGNSELVKQIKKK